MTDHPFDSILVSLLLPVHSGCQSLPDGGIEAQTLICYNERRTLDAVQCFLNPF